MAAVTQWVVKEYELYEREIVRPFWPGADYQKMDYSDNCVVIDNPPFSILSEICKFFGERKIAYFMFVPSLTLFSTNRGKENYIVTGTTITYENGAKVSTSFVTNLGNDKIFVAPELKKIIDDANAQNTKSEINLEKYEYPINVISAALLEKLAKYRQELRIKKEDCYFIRALDEQRKSKKSIFGAGFLLSERAEAERAAAERAAAVKWTLSEEEKQIINGLGCQKR